MTPMSAKGALSVSSIVVRSLVGGLATLAITWAIFVVPVFWRQFPVETIARRIIAEDSFNAESLASVKSSYSDLSRLEGGRPSVLSAAAAIDLRLLEQAIARSDLRNLDSLMNETERAIQQSLASSPADPFLWTVLFWLENSRNGFSAAHLDYLRMSYLVGPNEGWVGIKRNRFALAIFPSLTPWLAEKAVKEFSLLVGSNYFDAAADILEGQGWPIRDLLLSGLKGVDDISRQEFAKVIYRRGLDLSVPGVDRPEWRPWH
jgi:hypothetical protein